MARTTTATRSRASRASVQTSEPAAVGLELGGVGLCLGAVLVAAALLSFAPYGVGGGIRNVTGAAGHALAGMLTSTVGLGAWVLPAFLVAWGVGCLRGVGPTGWLRKGLLLPLLMALTAVEGALIFEGGGLPGLERSGPGGYFGLAMGSVAFDALGKASGLVVMVAWLSVFRLMTQINLVQAVFQAAQRLKPGGGAAVLERPTKKAASKRRSAKKAKQKEEELAEDEQEEPGYEDEEYEEYEDEDGEYEYEEEAEEEEAEYEEEEGEEYEEEEGEEEGGEEAPPVEKPRVRPPVVMGPSNRTKARRKTALPKRPTQTGDYTAPPLELLVAGNGVDPELVRKEVEENAEVLEESLASFGIDALVVSNTRGPVITFYEIKVPPGIRLSRVTALADDMAIALKAPSVRIVAPIPGRSTVGIEVPNVTREMVRLRDLLEDEADSFAKAAIPVVLGADTAGRPIVEDLAKMPHVLIAGATGSGKSVCVNAILLSILYGRGPDEVNLILVDPKQVELSFFEGIPHLLTPVVTDMRRAAKILEWAVERMEERYAMLLATGVRNIASYNTVPKERREAARERSHMTEESLPDHMPYFVIVIDELADIMLTNGKEVELSITRLAQKSRAVGIHLVLATQRPSTNVITGLIKANMPTRISFVVSSKIDSRVVLDCNGADRLLGNGDMLYMHPRSLHLRRSQGALVTDAESRATVDFLKETYPVQQYEDILKPKTGDLGDPMKEDDLYEDAVRAVLTSKLGSASMLQRRMGIGYTRASRLIDMMSDQGVVGPHVGSKAREVYFELEEWEADLAEKNQPIVRPSDEWDPEDPPPVDTSWD